MLTGWIRNTNEHERGRVTRHRIVVSTTAHKLRQILSRSAFKHSHTHTLYRHPRPPDVIEKMNQFLWRLSVVFVTKRWKTITLSVLLLLTSLLTLAPNSAECASLVERAIFANILSLSSSTSTSVERNAELLLLPHSSLMLMKNRYFTVCKNSSSLFLHYSTHRSFFSPRKRI